MKTPLTMKRRHFLRVAAVGTGGVLSAAAIIPRGAVRGADGPAPPQRMTADDLPKGSAPAPVPFPHFPSRLHAFVWRNWQLAPPGRMAAVVGATPKDIVRLGAAMGLGKPPPLSSAQQRRSYLTVIRRNWHLLPYEQLLQLLGWTPEQMAFTLREDDFFYIKLGSLKPRCDALRWAPRDEATRRREQEMAELMRRNFPRGVAEPADPMFAFVGRLSSVPKGTGARTVDSSQLRFCYSYFALYGDPFLEPDADPYPEGYLARLAGAGVNGVWLQAVLHKLAPFPWEPQLSDRWEERLQNLGKLVARAERRGMRVFLYLNEPRAMPLRFFTERPHLKGVTEGDYATLCTSAPEVQRFLTEAVTTICRRVPQLGGFFTITASENLTNCWSHHSGAGCPRCGKRPPAEVIAEVNGLFAEGIRRSGVAGPAAGGAVARPRLIAWDWGWDDAWTEGIIRRLPSEAALMSVSEWSLPIERGGVKSEVGEYSISAIGPGPRALRHWAWARQRGLRTVAKVQAGNTWELSSVPYLPAVENVAQHAANLHAQGVGDLMLSWTLGGYPSPNLEAVDEAIRSGSVETALQRVAEGRFGTAMAPAAVAAWRGFSAAFREFPYDGAVLYVAPQQMGPANPLWAKPTGYRATMTGIPYDDLDQWRSIYPSEVFAQQMEKVSDGFDRALAEFKEVTRPKLPNATREQRRQVEDECRVAEAASIHFRSTANQARFVMAREALNRAVDAPTAGKSVARLERVLEEELALAVRLHALQSQDSRLGFEAANHYFFVQTDLAEKVLNCRDLLDRWLPEVRGRWGMKPRPTA
jgi:hypothetical protein